MSSNTLWCFDDAVRPLARARTGYGAFFVSFGPLNVHALQTHIAAYFRRPPAPADIWARWRRRQRSAARHAHQVHLRLYHRHEASLEQVRIDVHRVVLWASLMEL